MQTINIQQKYKAFVRSYQSMPKVAKVVIEWNDNHQQHEFLISLDDYWIDEFSYPYRHTKVGRLTEEDILRLKEGITVYGKENLSSVLEDYE